MANSKGTLKYRKVQRTPQNGENAGKKLWYATAVSDREMDFESFVTHISEHGSPYSRGCVHGVLMDALDHLQELILDGKSVRLSDLGLFSIGMTSRGEESRDKVSAASVEGVHLIVRNTKNWSNSELRKKCKIESIDAKGFDAADATEGDGGGDNGGGNPGGSTPGGASGGTNRATKTVTTTGKKIFSFLLTSRRGFITICRSFSVVSAFIIGGWITGTSAM